MSARQISDAFEPIIERGGEVGDMKSKCATDEQVDRIVALLREGRSLKFACALTGVNVKAFRWQRHKSEVGRRVAQARGEALRDRAIQLRAIAKRLDEKAREIEAAG